jgi:hypothetical protein
MVEPLTSTCEGYKWNTEADFWAKVFKSDGCWLWVGNIGSTGYGKFMYHRKHWSAHKLAYYFTCGPVAENVIHCHSCDNPSCCRPSHIFLGTQQDNMDDMVSKGRSLYGEKHRNVKLTEASVIKIKHSQLHPRMLSSEYGVSVCTIRDIIAGRTWKYLKNG